jgi:6-phosphogluconolactonase
MKNHRRTTMSGAALFAGGALLAAVAAILFTGSAACRAEGAAGAASQASGPKGQAGPGAMWVYVGTYTGAKSKGIYMLRMDPASGALGPAELAAEAINPSFLAVHPGRRFLYAVSEVSGGAGKPAGAVSAFAVDEASGRLTLLNQQPTGGAGPCYVAVDQQGRNALAANYGSGSVCVLPIGADGRLAEASAFIQHTGSGHDPKRQAGPHAHCIDLDPAGRFALVVDLGLDKVFVYRFDPARGTLAANDPPAAPVAPGAGPRHVAFHPSGRFVYVINEMGGTVTAFKYDGQRGTLSEMQSAATLPADFHGQSTTAEIEVHPSGRFLYGSNRGHDSIAVFAVNGDGTLKPLGHQPTQGKNPRNFGIDPTGTWLLAANQGSDNVVVFRIDAETGGLTPTGAVVAVGAPVCVKFMPMP